MQILRFKPVALSSRISRRERIIEKLVIREIPTRVASAKQLILFDAQRLLFIKPSFYLHRNAVIFLADVTFSSS